MGTLAARRGSYRPLILAGVLGALVAGLVAIWWQVRPTPTPNRIAVLEANNRGIGHMERFDYNCAVSDFEEVYRLDPNWLPGLINLGIAHMNLAGGTTRSACQPRGTSRDQEYAQAQALFRQVLERDPHNPYADFCLGIIEMNLGDPRAAAPFFEAVVRADPDDAAAWNWLGSSLVDDDDRATECYRRAIALDPHLNAALNNLAMKLRSRDPARATQLFEEFRHLQDGDAEGGTRGNLVTTAYTEMGRYADVLSGDGAPRPARRVERLPWFSPSAAFTVQLAPGARWATAGDLRGDPVAALRARVRARFGGTIVVLDYDRDDRPDVLLLGAVVEGGKVRDLLLHNDGDGRFTDVTRMLGLAEARPSLGCCVGDFDNDGYPDLFITGVGEQHLFRNVPDGKGGRRFTDVTAAMGLDKLKTVCLGATFVDLDQDGDLDLVVAEYTTLDHVGDAFKSDHPPGDGRLVVFVNVGVAPPLPEAGQQGSRPVLINPKFVASEDFRPGAEMVAPSIGALLTRPMPVVGLAVSDVDQDNDVDLVVLADRDWPELLLNDRLLRFHHALLPDVVSAGAPWNGALVLDADQDGRSDLFLVRDKQPPFLLLNRKAAGDNDVKRWFAPGATNSPPLLQAHAVDLDMNGWPDVVGLSAEHRPVFLQNDGQRLVYQREALGSDREWPADVVGLAIGDFSGHGYPDLLLWSESQGLQLRVNHGNGNRALHVELTGLRGPAPEGPNHVVRCNADGIGTWVRAQAADLDTRLEYTTLSAGLGQSSQPLWLGLGRHSHADVLRLRWPDNVWQAELNVPTDRLLHLLESNRKSGSCPILFTWDGSRYVFVTDFLGAGSIGEMEPDGNCRMPRPEESIKIEPGQLRPRDGQYVLKLAEPMDEVTYLDRLQLVVVDHPSDMSVYPDERFVASGPPASQDLLTFRERIFPHTARDHHGRDVTQKLRAWDRDTVDDFARRAWLGYAEEHSVELDFGARLAKFGPHDRLVLCLAGWTDYPYPESIWAATQAGVDLVPPALERLGPDGKWHPLSADMGFPAGLPRMMTVDVTGLLGQGRCVLRLRTNMQVFWDQIFVAPLLERGSAETLAAKSATHVRVHCLEVSEATMSARGCMREYSPNGRQPTLYDYDRLEAIPVAPPAGRRTSFGDVTHLLRQPDDRFVIFGPGDEVTVRFDARRLPDLPPGWTRSFVLRTWGYCKDSSPFTATGATIEPLPSRAMRRYP